MDISTLPPKYFIEPDSAEKKFPVIVLIALFCGGIFVYICSKLKTARAQDACFSIAPFQRACRPTAPPEEEVALDAVNQQVPRHASHLPFPSPLALARNRVSQPPAAGKLMPRHAAASNQPVRLVPQAQINFALPAAASQQVTRHASASHQPVPLPLARQRGTQPPAAEQPVPRQAGEIILRRTKRVMYKE